MDLALVDPAAHDPGDRGTAIGHEYFAAALENREGHRAARKSRRDNRRPGLEIFCGSASGSLAAARLVFFLFEHRDLLQIFRLEDLVAVQAAKVIDPIAPHQEFRALVLTARHMKC